MGARKSPSATATGTHGSSRRIGSARRTERTPLPGEPGFELLGTVAARARPGLLAGLVAAAPAIVRVLHALEIEIGLPVGTLLIERDGAEAGLDPLHAPIRALPRLRHVVLILVA